MSARGQTIAALVNHGVVPVVRTPSAALALRAVTWLEEAGFGTFEITLTIPGALDLVRALAGDRFQITTRGLRINGGYRSRR